MLIQDDLFFEICNCKILFHGRNARLCILCCKAYESYWCTNSSAKMTKLYEVKLKELGVKIYLILVENKFESSLTICVLLKYPNQFHANLHLIISFNLIQLFLFPAFSFRSFIQYIFIYEWRSSINKLSKCTSWNRQSKTSQHFGIKIIQSEETCLEFLSEEIYQTTQNLLGQLHFIQYANPKRLIIYA